MQMTYEAQYEAYLSQAQQALEAACDEVLCPGSRVSEAARYSLLGGGKRVRAVLCIAACDMLGGDTTLAARYAAGLEMLHCYSLIHDDLPCMDDDDMRRGRPSCHRAYGEATALLAGDALLTAAFETLAGAGHGGQAQNSRAVSVLAASAGARGMVRGQELDLYYESSPASEAQLCEVHRNKTGMLIAAAVVSTTQELGKPVGSDVQKGKTTFVTLHGVEGTRALAARTTADACDTLAANFGEASAFLCTFAQSLISRTM